MTGDRQLILQKDPRAGYLAHKQEIDEAVARVLASGWYILGEEVAVFEREFADYVGVRHAIGVGSGTEALHLALRLCGVGRGDAVFTVSHTAVATVAAIELAGATPVFVDIDPLTYTMSPESLEDAVKAVRGSAPPRIGRPKAVMPVHLYGHPADMPALMSIARRHNLLVFEDCAQSHGATLDGRKTGAWGDVAGFSFYPTKGLGAYGDGGMILTNDAELAERARELREYGWSERYVSRTPGMNSRLDELQAAILRVKLRHLDRDNGRVRGIAMTYDAALRDCSLVAPHARAGVEHVYHQYVVRTSDRERFRAHLRDRGIATAIHYPVPVHRQAAYQHRIPLVSPLDRTDAVMREIVSLPIYPEITDTDVRMIGRELKAWDEALAKAERRP